MASRAHVQKIRRRMEKLFTNLDYDFSTFSLAGFVAWLEETYETRIELLARPLPVGVFGLWVKCDVPSVQFVLYNEALGAFHQGHAAIHELAHWLCGHQTLTLTLEEVPYLFESDQTAEMLIERGVATRVRREASEAEDEAEMLAFLIEEQVARFEHLSSLTMKAQSSIDSLDGFYRGLGVFDG